MTIGFPNASRAYDATRNAVHFWGHDRSMEASFFVSAEALLRLMPGAAGDQTALLDVFDRNRARSREAAARRYGRGRKGSYDINPNDF